MSRAVWRTLEPRRVEPTDDEARGVDGVNRPGQCVRMAVAYAEAHDYARRFRPTVFRRWRHADYMDAIEVAGLSGHP
jgi:hypothetical protein